jgi:membrane associated rhomboid family serine protease
MGESERYIEYKHLKKKKFLLGSDNNALMALVVLNVIFFLLLLTTQVVYFFYQQSAASYNSAVVQWFELPADFTRLTERPWTIITYMFSDTGAGLMRIISNMIWLWAFGYIFQQLAGNDKIIPVYIYGGLLGAIFFIAAYYFIPSLKTGIGDAALIGANAATMAVATATTFLSPNHRFFTQIRKGIPIWILLVVYFIIDFAGVTTVNAAFSLSHIGGMVAGILFAFFLQKGIDASIWMNKLYFWLTHLFTPKKSSEKKSVKDQIFYNTGNREPFIKNMLVNQNRIDSILDKINSSGYNSLTDEEKEILKKASDKEGQ